MTREPEFGPRGYLPPRAAKRARKIILREPMGLQWAVAALIAGVLVVAAGALLLVRTGPPAAPFVPVGELVQIDPRGAGVVPLDDRHAIVVRAAGGVTVLAAPDADVAWCAERGRLIAAGVAAWRPDGRLVGGTGTSLPRLPAQVHDGLLYVDPTAPGVALTAATSDEPTTCPGTG